MYSWFPPHTHQINFPTKLTPFLYCPAWSKAHSLWCVGLQAPIEDSGQTKPPFSAWPLCHPFEPRLLSFYSFPQHCWLISLTKFITQGWRARCYSAAGGFVSLFHAPIPPCSHLPPSAMQGMETCTQHLEVFSF